MVKKKINWKGILSGIVLSLIGGLILESIIVPSISFLNKIIFGSVTIWTLIFWSGIGISAVLGEKNLFKK